MQASMFDNSIEAKVSQPISSSFLEFDDVRLYLGDCLHTLKNIENNSIDFIATDPPYFLDGMGDEWSDIDLNTKKSKAGAIKGLPVGMKFDPNQGLRLGKFFYQFAKRAIRVLKPGGFMVAFSQGRLYHHLATAVENAGFEVRDMLVWEHGGGQGKAFTQDHFVKKMPISESDKKQIIRKLQHRKTPQLRPKFEAMVLAQKPKSGTFVQNWLQWQTGLIKTDFDMQQTTVFPFSKPNLRKEIDHMTIKPIDLMERLIEIFSLPGQVVMDPFLGSGTTGIAAINLSRKFVGIEIEEKYYNIAQKRINAAHKSSQNRQSLKHVPIRA